MENSSSIILSVTINAWVIFWVFRNTDLTMDTFCKHLETVLCTDSWGPGAFVTFDIISPFSNVLTYLLTEVKYCTMLKLFMMSAFPHALVRLRKQYEIHSVIFIEMEIYRDGADVTRRGVCSRHESSGEREKLGHLQSTTVYDGRSADDDDAERSIPLLHTDVSVRACTSCRPFLITSKSCWILLLSTVSYRKHLF